MRIVIELRRDAYPRVVVNNLYKQTPLQANFGANMLALVDAYPQLLSLKQFLSVFLDFRIVTITRRTQYQLRKAEERDHILQGLLIALRNLDAIIILIRGAADAPTARLGLIERFGLSDAQGDAILQMQLRRLTALEADKIHQEHDDLQIQITDLRDILARRERILTIIETELAAIKAAHATPRRTVIEQSEDEIMDADLIANERAVILLTEQGYIKRMPVNTFESQNRATRGKSGTRMKEDDAVEQFLACRDHDSILFFSDRGVVYCVRAYQIPVSSRTARGTAIVQLLPIPHNEKITSFIPVSEFSEDEYLVMLTNKGYIKKTALSAFKNIRANGLIAISLEEADLLRWVRRARAEDTILIGSEFGKSIHFRASHDQLRPLGRATRGVRAMALRQGDSLVGLDILPSEIVETLAADLESGGGEDEAICDDATELETVPSLETAPAGPWILTVTAYGYGKRVPVTQFRLQNRAGMGIVATKFRKPGDHMASLRIVHEGEELMLITNRGIIIRQAINAISCQSRSASGVRLQRLDEDDEIVAVALVPASDAEEDALLDGESGEETISIAASPVVEESIVEASPTVEASTTVEE